ncbi:hypothetical protein H5410_032726 [Solanum commersonii]|uniref:Uncharacterized protein n=1 Tax=Solanum commersonii TaxID=4109 RepID=A0A9J5YQG8_SOLCO|nr:hypothetical protein H5410_032726 [Solanum commersonii]
MAPSCVMLLLSFSLTFLSLTVAQVPTMPPSSIVAPSPGPAVITKPPVMSPPAPVAFPPTMSPGPSVSISPTPDMPASPPAPVGPGPVSGPAPGPSDGDITSPSSAFMHGSSMVMVALIGSVALLF